MENGEEGGEGRWSGMRQGGDEMKSKKIRVIIATHKKYRMPKESIYFPLHVGAKGKQDLGYARDDIGDNISEKNSGFCELTGLYWAWKNLDCDYLGLAHYRRHFSCYKKKDVWKAVLTTEQAINLCENYDVILPKKRKYYIESLYSHYAHTHYAGQLDEARKIIKELCPDYLGPFDIVMKNTSGYMFNMYIMRKDLSDIYCEWLFGILFELEKRIEMPELSEFQGRFYGRVSEILFNVWLQYYKSGNENVRIKEIGYIHMEPVNWWKKGISFLRAKFFSVKYEGSY